MSRRVIAAAGLLAALASGAAVSLDHLRRATGDYRRAVAAAALPRLSARSGQLIAADAGRARADLSQRIGDAAADAGIRLSVSPSTGADPIEGIVATRVVARGEEARLLRFSLRVEQGATLIRWSRWSILPDGDGGLRLSANAVAPWRAR